MMYTTFRCKCVPYVYLNSSALFNWYEWKPVLELVFWASNNLQRVELIIIHVWLSFRNLSSNIEYSTCEELPVIVRHTSFTRIIVLPLPAKFYSSQKKKKDQEEINHFLQPVDQLLPLSATFQTVYGPRK